MKTLEVPAALRVRIRPSSKYAGIAVTEVFLAIDALGIGLGLELRTKEELVAGDPLAWAIETGCDQLKCVLADSMDALLKKNKAHGPLTSVPPPSTSSESDRLKITALTAQLIDLQAKYDALELHGLGISGE
jgi:hypothetical protein